MIHAFVPVKLLAIAKGRLAPLLAPEERQALVLAMLGDVLAALRATPGVATISVVCSDPRVQAAAHAAGVRALDDHGADLNGALTEAIRRFGSGGGGRALVVFADVPLVTPGELSAFVAHGTMADVVLAASDDGGTNAMLLPQDAHMPLLFGQNSLARHTQAALAQSVRAEVVRLPGLAFDVDRPDDVLRLAELGDTVAARLARGLSASVRL